MPWATSQQRMKVINLSVTIEILNLPKMTRWDNRPNTRTYMFLLHPLANPNTGEIHQGLDFPNS